MSQAHGIAPHAEAYTLAVAALEAERALNSLPAGSLAAKPIGKTLDALRTQLAPVAHTLASHSLLSERNAMAAWSWWTCPDCNGTDAALMRAVDAAARCAKELGRMGDHARASKMSGRVDRMQALVECPVCRFRIAGEAYPAVLDRDSQRRPRRPRVTG